jgi:hypothetical protein
MCRCATKTTDVNLEQVFCLASRAPTLDLEQKITKSRTFVIQRFIQITKLRIQVPFSLQAKMAQQGEQMRVGGCGGFTYHLVKPILLANGETVKGLSSIANLQYSIF